MGAEVTLRNTVTPPVPRNCPVIGMKCSLVGIEMLLAPRASAIVGMKWIMIGPEPGLEPVEPALRNAKSAMTGIEWMMVGMKRGLAHLKQSLARSESALMGTPWPLVWSGCGPGGARLLPGCRRGLVFELGLELVPAGWRRVVAPSRKRLAAPAPGLTS